MVHLSGFSWSSWWWKAAGWRYSAWKSCRLWLPRSWVVWHRFAEGIPCVWYLWQCLIDKHVCHQILVLRWTAASHFWSVPEFQNRRKRRGEFWQVPSFDMSPMQTFPARLPAPRAAGVILFCHGNAEERTLGSFFCSCADFGTRERYTWRARGSNQSGLLVAHEAVGRVTTA